MAEELYGAQAGNNLTAAQSVQTQNCVDVTLAGNSTSAGAGYVLISSGTLTLAGGNNVTLSQNGNGVTISAPSFATQVYAVSNVGSTGTVTRFAPEDHKHVGLAGVNASGTASTFVGNLMISVGNNLTMSTGGNSSAGTIQFFDVLSSSALAANVSNVSSAGSQTANFALVDHAHVGVAGINASGTASTFVGNVMISGGSNISLATGGNSSAGTLAIHALGAGTGFTTGSTTDFWSATNGTNGLSMIFPLRTRYVFPVDQHLTPVSAPVPGSATFRWVPVNAVGVTGTRIDALVLWSATSAATTATAAIAMSAYAAIYTRNGAALSSLSSGSTQTTYTYASNSAGNTQLFTAAIRPVSVPVNFNMQAGEYFVGFNFFTSASSVGLSTTNLGQTLSMIGIQGLVTASNFAADFTAVTASSSNFWGGMGVRTGATSTGLEAAPALSNIMQTGSSLSQADIALVFRNG